MLSFPERLFVQEKSVHFLLHVWLPKKNENSVIKTPNFFQNNSLISTETWQTLFRINPQGVFLHISSMMYRSWKCASPSVSHGKMSATDNCAPI
jgi:hypothetical protein